MSGHITPNHREIIYAQGASGAPEPVTSINGALNIAGSFSVTGGATSANQTNGSQKAQIVDGSGNVIASTANALNVAITSGGGTGGTSSTFGAAFPGVGSAIGASDGTNMQGLLVESSTNKNLRISLYNGSTEATVTAGNALKVDGSAVTQPVSAASLPLPTGAATLAKQPALGTAGTASSDVITVQGIASMTALKVDGSAVTQPVSGTVAVSGTVTSNATLSAETTKVIGVTRTADGSGNLLTSTTNALDVNLKSSGVSNLSTNIAQMNGVTVTMGNGVAGTGVQRVTLASDSSGQVALAAGTAAVGSVNLSPTTAGGYTVSSQTALTATATVSGSAGKFGGYMFLNLNSAPAYIQVFDTTSAVTLGSTAPTFVIPIPANSTAANGVAANLEMANGIAMASGIKIAATTTATGASTVSTGLTGFVLYK